MVNYPQELAQDAVCQSHTGHMTELWFLPARPLRLNTNEYIHIYIYIYMYRERERELTTQLRTPMTSFCKESRINNKGWAPHFLFLIRGGKGSLPFVSVLGKSCYKRGTHRTLSFCKSVQLQYFIHACKSNH
jgi:hypothetical protein